MIFREMHLIGIKDGIFWYEFKTKVEAIDALDMIKRSNDPRYIHAIEKKAYDDLMADALKLVEALKFCSRVTYGTELINSDEENNEIIAGHFFNSQKEARIAIKQWQEKYGCYEL